MSSRNLEDLRQVLSEILLEFRKSPSAGTGGHFDFDSLDRLHIVDLLEKYYSTDLDSLLTDAHAWKTIDSLLDEVAKLITLP